MARAVALLSGGLDSTLAILAMIRLGVGVDAVQFLTGFESAAPGDPEAQDTLAVGKKFGFRVEKQYLDEKFLEVLMNPAHGYGKNMNPCIDCRILMLREARKIMQARGADFLVTGEVIGQRPMSQRKNTLFHIDREAGVTGMVVRPLSGKLLTPTDAEERGLIRREDLHDFSGRSRKPQIALAEAFGLTGYPAPAGGCLLTEPNFAFRLSDLLKEGRVPTHNELELMKIGRHFRVSDSCRIIVGRDERENDMIESLAARDDCLLRVDGVGSPVTLVTGEITDHALQVAASLCVRYSDAKKLAEAEVLVQRHGESSKLTASPAGTALIESLRIEEKPEKPATS